MAVLDVCPGITAEVLIAGQPASEYDDIDKIIIKHDNQSIAEYQAARTVSKYIQSQTAQPFSIKFTVGAPYIKGDKMDHVKIGFHVTVDGIFAGTIWLSRLWFRNEEVGAVWEDEMKGVKLGKGRKCTIREFAFAKIDSNDKDSEPAALKRLAQKMKAVGAIEIKVYNESAGKKGGDIKATTDGFMKRIGAEIPEKALKGDSKSHGTSLNAARRVSRGPFFRTKLKDGEDYPLIIFRFLYRNEETLKKLRVKDCTPTPSPTPSPSPSPSASPSPSPNTEHPAAGSEITPEQQLILSELIRKMTEENARGTEASRAASASASTRSSKKRKYNHKKAIKIKREKFEEYRKKMKVAQREKTKREAKDGKAEPVLVDLTSGDNDDDEGEEDDHGEVDDKVPEKGVSGGKNLMS